MSEPVHSSGTATPLAEPPHHCFICLVDSGEEGDTDDWVNPCPCALEAHHACLLKWIDEMQDEPVACPQCRAPIRAVGADDLVVSLEQRIRGALKYFAPTIVSTSLMSTLAAGQVWYGKMSAGIFAEGRYPEVVELRPLSARTLAGTLGHAFIMPGLVMGSLYPNVSIKIASPISIMYLSSQVGVRRQLTWPPDIDMAFACLPYLTMAYKAVRWKMLGELENSWDRILYGWVDDDDPRNNRALRDMIDAVVEDFDRNNGPANDGLVQARVEVIIEEEPDDDEEDEASDSDDEVPALLRNHREAGLAAEEEGEIVPRPGEEQQAAPEHAPAPQPRPAQEPAREPEPQPAEPAPAQPNRRRARVQRLSIVSTLIKMSVALALPSISYSCGELLRLVLPKAYTMSPRWGARPGLLQQTWGRSFVGGCMFFVVKDMVQTYFKYRRAAAKSLRRVPSVPRRHGQE